MIFLSSRGIGAAALGGGLAGCHRTPPPMPLSQLNAVQMAGHDVFQAKCAQCHDDRTDDAKNGPSLLGTFKKPSLHSGAAATDERVTSTILHGHGLMPAMGNRMDDEQVQEVLAYLHTL